MSKIAINCYRGNSWIYDIRGSTGMRFQLRVEYKRTVCNQVHLSKTHFDTQYQRQQRNEKLLAVWHGTSITGRKSASDWRNIDAARKWNQYNRFPSTTETKRLHFSSSELNSYHVAKLIFSSKSRCFVVIVNNNKVNSYFILHSIFTHVERSSPSVLKIFKFMLYPKLGCIQSEHTR